MKIGFSYLKSLTLSFCVISFLIGFSSLASPEISQPETQTDTQAASEAQTHPTDSQTASQTTSHSASQVDSSLDPQSKSQQPPSSPADTKQNEKATPDKDKKKSQSEIKEPLIDSSKPDDLKTDQNKTTPVASKNERKNMILLGGNIQFLNGPSTIENAFDLIARYGWNKGQYELGPAVFIEGANYGSGYDMYLMGGGFFDYNLVNNKSSQENMIYGFHSEALIGTKRFAKGGNAQIGLLDAGGFLSVFLNQTSVAIRTEFVLRHKFIFAEEDNTSVTGFAGKLAFMYYY